MSKDYKVGYGKPPSASQFKKGQSGNPKGRPKSSKNLSLGQMYELELNRGISIIENGKRKYIRVGAALIRKQIQQSLNGDPRSAKLLMDHAERAEVRRHNPVIKQHEATKKMSEEELDARISELTALIADSPEMPNKKPFDPPRTMEPPPHIRQRQIENQEYMRLINQEPEKPSTEDQ